MLISALVCRTTASALHAVGATHSLAQVSNRDRDHQVTESDLRSLSRLSVDALVVSVDAGPQLALITGLRHYRATQPDIRILLLAPGRDPGDPLVSALVGLGIYDILNGEGEDLGEALQAALDRPAATYAHAARWHSPSISDTHTESSAPQEREILRVMASRERPLWIAVTGATRAAGTTTLTWSLANELARKGATVALLVDLSPQECDALATVLDPGLTVTLRSFAHPPFATDRIAGALEFGETADVVLMDLGHLRKALETGGQILAMADQLLICWPQSLPRLVLGIQGFQAFSADALKQNQLLRHTLAQAIHIPYLCHPQQTRDAVDLVASTLAETITGPHGPVVPVPMGVDGLQLQDLMSHLAPVSTKERTLFGLVKRWWLPKVGSLLLVCLLLWFLLGGLHLAGLPLPDWISVIAETPVKMLRSILGVVH